MNNNYKVVYTGMLKTGTDVEQFVQGFMQMFKAPEAQARTLATLGRHITLKDNLEQAVAEKYRQAMDGLGMQVHVEAAVPAADLGAATQPVAMAPRAEVAIDLPRCPKCGSTRINGDDCLACGIIISRYRERQARSVADPVQDNPYAAPQSDLTLVKISDAEEMSGPHSMPAGNGWTWIAGGWSHFSKNPLAWIGAMVVWLLLMMFVSLIPLLGSVAINLLAPVFTAGFMLGANEQREGGNFEVRHLFAGFSANTGGLVLVGLFYMIGTVLVMIVAAAIAGGALLTMNSSLTSGNIEPQALMTVAGPLLLALLVAVALLIPLMMAYWFAPALVALDGMAPFAAMKLSFSACLKNILPYLVYSVIAVVFMILAVLPFGLGLIVLLPIMMAAIYASYRDIFYGAP